jgi:hypothetical protein
MDEQLTARFEDAQRRTIALVSALFRRLEPGMSELTIARLAADMLPEHGFDRWFYPPEVQIGGNTTRAGVWRPPSPRTRLHRGETLMLALGPSDGRASGDISATRVFGQPDSKLVERARDCTRATCGYSSGLKCIGELFIYARTWAANHQLALANPRSIGHALLPPTGRLASGYPRSAHMATWLRRYQVHFLNPRRLWGMWALGPQLTDQRAGARFREVILVGPGTRKVLGRDSLDQVGCF